MTEVEKLSGKLGIDTTDFKTAIGAANRELRVLESSFKAGAAALGDWTKDASGLEARMKTLTSQIDIQRLKVDALRAEHQRLVEANGANSRAAQDAEIKLNKETETLNKMTVELEDTTKSLDEMKSRSGEAGDAVEDLGENANETGGKLDGLKSVLKGVGAVITTTVGLALGLVAAVAAVGGAITGLIFSTATASADLVDLSSKTGISVERLQELDFIANQVGTSLDTITGAQARLIRSMNEGRDGTGNQAEAFKALGVSVVDAEGNLRNTEEVFYDVIDALSQIENPAEADALAMQLFGKSAQELNPLIRAGSDEMERLAEEAHNVGAVMSEEDVAAFEAFDDTLASLQAGLKGVVGTLLSAFLPGFQSVFDQVGGYLQQFKAIVDGSGGDFGKIAEGLTGLITQIANDIAQQAPAFLEAGLGIVQSILNAITAALPSMLDAAISILTSLIDFIVQNLPTLIQAAVQILLTLVNALVQNLPMLVTAALQAVIALATGLAEALPVLVPAIVEAIILIVETLIENLPLLIDAAGQLLLGLAEGLILALPILLAAIPQVLDALVDALLVVLPQILGIAGELIGMLVYGILANLPILLVGVGQILVTIGKALVNIPKLLVESGKNLIQGLIEGLKSAQGLLYDAVTNIVNNMIDTIKSTLGISSPSKVGRGFGQNFIGSMALGGEDAMRDVQRSFASMTGRLAVSAASGFGAGAAVNGASLNNSNNSTRVDVFGNVIVTGETSPDSLADELTRRRY